MKLEQANKMTAQELCDYAVLKIVEQGGQSATDEGQCLMLDEKGRRCAFSWTLDKSDPLCMGWDSSALGFISNYAGKTPQAFISSPRVAETLQLFHDTEIKEYRRKYAKYLNTLGISTDAPQYQQWIEMGEGA